MEARLAGVGAEIAVAQVGDYRPGLFSEEASYAESVVHARALEFSTGREVARTALGRIGVADCEIPRRGRLPVWPPSAIGSIAHTRTLAAAGVAPATSHHGLGIDIEAGTAVSGQVAERVLTWGERDWLPAPEWRTMVFSAKEAGTGDVPSLKLCCKPSPRIASRERVPDFPGVLRW